MLDWNIWEWSVWEDIQNYDKWEVVDWASAFFIVVSLLTIFGVLIRILRNLWSLKVVEFLGLTFREMLWKIFRGIKNWIIFWSNFPSSWLDPIIRKHLGIKFETILKKEEMQESVEKHGKRIEKYFDSKVFPIVDRLRSIDKTLYGMKGSEGIVEAMKVLKWGYGLGAAALGALLAKVFIV